MKFIGRDCTTAAPLALTGKGALSNTAGAVLDPIVAVRHVIRLAPGAVARIDLVLGVAESREAVSSLAEKYFDPSLADRAFELAGTHSQSLLRQLNASEAESQAVAGGEGAVA